MKWICVKDINTKVQPPGVLGGNYALTCKVGDVVDFDDKGKMLDILFGFYNVKEDYRGYFTPLANYREKRIDELLNDE